MKSEGEGDVNGKDVWEVKVVRALSSGVVLEVCACRKCVEVLDV